MPVGRTYRTTVTTWAEGNHLYRPAGGGRQIQIGIEPFLVTPPNLAATLHACSGFTAGTLSIFPSRPEALRTAGNNLTSSRFQVNYLTVRGYLYRV